MMIIGRIGDGLRNLGKFLAGIFVGALNWVLRAIGGVIQKIVNKIRSIINAVADAIAAEQKLAGQGSEGGSGGGFAAGGWVGLHGPERVLVGERGPEYVVPNHRLGTTTSGGGMGVSIVGVSEREILDMVDRGLYFRLQRAAPARVRS
jgi:hypothetical protein